MAGSFSDYAENAILLHTFKKTAFTQATNLYVGLSKSTITDAHTGTTLPGEISGGSYARKKCNTWTVSGTGPTKAANTAPVTFASATAAWGTAHYFFIADKTTKGNIISFGVLSADKAIASGDTARFATADLYTTLD